MVLGRDFNERPDLRGKRNRPRANVRRSLSY
jgi:hypothetical protein